VNQHALHVLEYSQVTELVARYAASGLGKRRALELTPLADLGRVQTLLQETTELKSLLEPENVLPMGGLRDLFPLLDRLVQGDDILVPEELLVVADTLRGARNVRAYLAEADASLPLMRHYASAIHVYPEVEERIFGALNDGGAIRNTASSRLKSVRREIQQSRSRIQAKLQSLLRSSEIAPLLQDTGIRDVNGRPTLAVKAQHAARLPGARRDRSATGSTIFVEPEAVRSMSAELETLLNDEKAEMKRILQELTALIAARQQELRQSLDVLAHIDMTYAKVRFSREFGMNPPELNTEGILRLRQACHPLLLELHRQTGEPAIVVPLDVELGDRFQTLIVTGPNTGGKTLTLKTIGLLALMAQSGLHVPAEAAVLPVFGDVLADIGDEQSIEQSLSTFSSHLRNIAEILSQADSRALVLMDELGGGTDPAEGAALARAILEFLQERQARTAVSTHISELKRLAFTVPGVENASIEFDLETLAPTHRLLTGTPGGSNALAIARRMGLPGEVIDRAESSALEGGPSAEIMDQLQTARSAAAVHQRETEQRRLEAQRLEEEWRQRLDQLEGREAELEALRQIDTSAALRYAHQQLGELIQRGPSRRELLQAVGELESQLGAPLARQDADGESSTKLTGAHGADGRGAASASRAGAGGAKGGNTSASHGAEGRHGADESGGDAPAQGRKGPNDRAVRPEDAASQVLQVGDQVLIRSLARVGMLQQISQRRGRAVVLVGALPMRVGLDDVAPLPGT
jgi:DNA mismatch repair protein MutS2